MKIQVFGSGCSNCKKLHEIVQKVATEMGIKDNVEYVGGPDGIQKIVELGVMGSPVLVVNGKIAMTGFSSDTAKIKAILKASKG
jgi:small redox-active disulfide protein 2